MCDIGEELNLSSGPLVENTDALDDIQREIAREVKAKIRAGVGSLLCIRVGGGKTRIALSALVTDECLLLIIVPKSIMNQWLDELRALFGGGVHAILYHGTKGLRSQRLISLDKDTARIVITTKETVWRDVDTLLSVPWTNIIIDEVHLLRGGDGTKAYDALMRFPQVKLGLTATPVIGDALNDLGNLITLLHPGASLIKGLPTVKALRRAHVVSRTKAEMGIRDIPVHVHDVYVTMGEDEVEAYRAQHERLRDAHKHLMEQMEASRAIGLGSSMQAAHIRYIKELNGLRICSIYHHLHAVVERVRSIKALYAQRIEAGEKDVVKKRREALRCVYTQAPLTSKLRYVVDSARWLHKTGTHVVIFSEYVVTLEVMAAHLEVPYALVTGSMTRKERESQLKKWKAGECFMLFLTRSSGGVGLNLAEAHHVIMMDTSWDPQKEEQAIGRVNRRTQKANKIRVSRIVVAGSFDCVRHSVFASKNRQLEAALGTRVLEDDDTVDSIYRAVSDFDHLYGQWLELHESLGEERVRCKRMLEIETGVSGPNQKQAKRKRPIVQPTRVKKVKRHDHRLTRTNISPA